MKYGKKLLSLAVAGVTLALFIGNTASAQSTSQGGNALRISPVRQDYTIKPGESRDVEVVVQNLTDKPTILRMVVNDFRASSDESGNPSILLDENSYADSHGLKRYVKTLPDFTLAPNEQRPLKTTISIPASAAGGGYFGAIRFVPTASDGGATVSLAASVGSLALVTVPGDLTEKVMLETFNVRQGEKASTFFTGANNLKAVLRFKNQGNVQSAPFGKINVKKNGKSVGSVEINSNQPRGTILPDSIRRYETDLKGVSGFGKYTLEGNFGYGTGGQLISSKTTFYVVPWAYIIGFIVLLAAIAFAIFKWRSGRVSTRSHRRR